MKILFIHQNFPGQFRHLAPALAALGHEVMAFTMQANIPHDWSNITVIKYSALQNSTVGIHPWLEDFETKVIRAESVYKRALALKHDGFSPDLIIGHPGWGECLLVKRVWPNTKLGLYCEYYYQAEGADYGFDPEFLAKDESDIGRLVLKNLTNDSIMKEADGAISPTKWQASTYREFFRNKLNVIHDGINTEEIKTKKSIQINIAKETVLTKHSEVVTFVSRNLEPTRGFHVFMRAIPELLLRRPKVNIIIIGDIKKGYGPLPIDGISWRDQLITEIRPRICDADWARVHFLGHVSYDDYLAFLQISSIHVYLTYPFVLSWSLLEAMSAGCSIVASDTKPVHEFIIHDDTGRLVNFFDNVQLTQSICELLDSPQERQRLSYSARAFIQAKYDLNNVCLPRQLDWVNELLAA